MPILGQHDMVEALGEAIDDRHHRIAVGNRERAAGAEIVLHVDDQQQIIVAGLRLHLGPALQLTSNFSAWRKLWQQELRAARALAASARRFPACLAFHERLLDDELTGLAVIAFDKTLGQ